MNDHPNIGPPPTGSDQSLTRDPAQIDAQTETISPDSVLSPAMPDLSIAAGSSSSPKPIAPEPPKLDGYNVITPIGEGGMGTVWRAVQLSTRRNVALKLISAAGFASERARQRFDREVEITARLEHPNIARVYDSGINRGVYFYAMELIDGVPLDQYVSNHHLNRPDILRLFAIVCHAVDHAHQRGVIHRDLKPGNIIVSPEGQPHVLDFGLAKALEQVGKEAGISLDGEIAGTPGFMSPEQAAGKIDLDARCDVYSLGVILYRLLTGQTPHDLSGTYLDVLRRVSDEEPKRPRIADRTMDRELEALLLRALQRDPSHRYKSAGDLAQDVESYVRGDPITAKPPTVLYFARKRAHKHRVKIITASIVMLLAGLATLLTVRLIRSHRAGIISDGNSHVSKGEADANARNWSDANAEFLSAFADFEKAGAPVMPANLGLWNLARIAPPPLITILPPQSTAPATVSSLVVLADNRRALAGYDDGSVRVFDLATGRLVQTIAAENNPIRSLAASADGRLVLIGGDAGSMKLWDLATGALKTDFRNPDAPLKNRVTHVALSPDAHYALSVSGASPELLASSNYNDTVTLWDMTNGRALLTTNRSAKVFDVNQTVTVAIFSRNSSMVLTASAQAVVWSVGDGKQIAAMPDSAMAAAFSSDDRAVVTGSSQGIVRLLDVKSGNVSTVREQGNAIQAIGFDSVPDQFVTITDDGPLGYTISSIDLKGHERWSLPTRGDIDCLALSPNSRLALTTGSAGLCVWRVSQPPEMRDLAIGEPFSSVAISGDGRLVMGRPGSRRTARSGVLFDSATGKNITPSVEPMGRFTAMDRDGKVLAAVDGKGLLSVWSLDPPHVVREYTSEPMRSVDDLTAIAISNDGEEVAFNTSDNSVKVYPVHTGEMVKLTGHAAAVGCAAFSPNGGMLLTGSEDQTARLWDVQRGDTLAVLRGHAAPVNAVAISDDGKLAVTASGAAAFQGGNDNSVRLWEIPSGKPLGVLQKKNSERVNAVAISSDGQLIASGTDDQTVTLWDRASGEELRTIRTSHGPVLALAFDQSGHSLAVGSSDALSLWNLHRPVEQRELEPAVAAVRAKDPASPLTPADYLALGRWYAFEDEPAWAAMMFQQAEAGGLAVPALERWRCDWERGDLMVAEQDIKRLTPHDAPAFYINLCAEAIRLEKAPH